MNKTVCLLYDPAHLRGNLSSEGQNLTNIKIRDGFLRNLRKRKVPKMTFLEPFIIEVSIGNLLNLKLNEAACFSYIFQSTLHKP